MALLEGTIAIIVYIVVILLLFKLLRSVIKTVLIAFLLILAVFALTGYLIYDDATDFYENFGNSSKTLYLSDGENLLAGVSMVKFSQDNMTFVSLEELKNLETYYKDQQYKEMLKNDYKIFIFDISIFNETLDEGISFETGNLNSMHISGELINESLYSEKPLEVIYKDFANDFIDQQVKAGKLPKQVMENDSVKLKLKEEFIATLEKETNLSAGQARALIFGFLLKSELEKDMVQQMYFHYKKGSLKIYKETIMFKLLKFAPSTIVEKTISRISGSISEDES